MPYDEFDVLVNDIDEHELELVIYSALLLILIVLYLVIIEFTGP